MTQDSIIVAIVVGSVSGVFASGLLWLLKHLFFRHFLPFYQSVTYRGSSIHGTWVAYYPLTGEEKKAFATIHIKQSAHAVEAQYIMHLGDDDGDLTFDCKGEYWEGYLSMLGRSHLRTNYSILTALLKLKDSGATMQGDVAGRHRAKDHPETIQGITFEREA
ncbi:hypothetical protein [Wenzhouxiangella sediminis]|uniref:hypothetical protein n=1 Tax=Wenzhouxiangella sediminis TaxID=1792836 RepID=UPI0011C051CF|nr:hypothetical protein [Wenzhouxiangella sediminis]